MGFNENTNGRPYVYWKFQAERISKAKCFKASTKGLILSTGRLGNEGRPVSWKKFWLYRIMQKCPVTSITQLKFRILTWSSSIFINKPAIRIFILRVLVQGFHVRVSWCWIKIVIAFLHIFTMVSFKNNNLIINLSKMISEKLKSLKSKLWLQFELATWLCPYFQEKWTGSKVQTETATVSASFYALHILLEIWSLECCFLYLSFYFTKLNFLLYWEKYITR